METTVTERAVKRYEERRERAKRRLLGDYREFLEITNDPQAAATLVLALDITLGVDVYNNE